MKIKKNDMETIKGDPAKFVELMLEKPLRSYQIELLKGIAEGEKNGSVLC